MPRKAVYRERSHRAAAKPAHPLVHRQLLMKAAGSRQDEPVGLCRSLLFPRATAPHMMTHNSPGSLGALRPESALGSSQGRRAQRCSFPSCQEATGEGKPAQGAFTGDEHNVVMQSSDAKEDMKAFILQSAAQHSIMSQSQPTKPQHTPKDSPIEHYQQAGKPNRLNCLRPGGTH